MEQLWADVVRQFHHDDKRAWADDVTDDEADVVPAPLTWDDLVRQSHHRRAWADDEVDLPANASASIPAVPANASASIPAKAKNVTWAEVVGKVNYYNSSEDSSYESDIDSVGETNEGDPVGIRAVQSILMSATQMSLSHFHTAGMDTIVSARLTPTPAEAMNFTYANTSMTFQSSDDVYYLRKQLVGATISSFLTTVGSSLTGFHDRENIWYEASGKQMYEGTVLRFYIDYNKMRNHGLTLVDLARATFGEDVNTSTSPDFMGMIDVDVTDDYISQWLAKTNDLVCGTPRIRSCNKANSSTAITKGSDILAASKIDSINKCTITSNNVPEVESHFGIEAATAVLAELTGSHVVSDFMARTGKILPFVKSSVEVKQKGMMTSMGFEKPKEDIKKKSTPSTSVYESIITGADPKSNFKIIV